MHARTRREPVTSKVTHTTEVGVTAFTPLQVSPFRDPGAAVFVTKTTSLRCGPLLSFFFLPHPSSFARANLLRNDETYSHFGHPSLPLFFVNAGVPTSQHGSCRLSCIKHRAPEHNSVTKCHRPPSFQRFLLDFALSRAYTERPAPSRVQRLN